MVALGAMLEGAYAGVPRGGIAFRPMDAPGLVVITVLTLALAARTAAPLPAALVTASGGVVYYGLGYPGVFAAAPALICIYTLTTRGRRLQAILVAVAMTTGVYVIIALADTDPGPDDGFQWIMGWLVASVVAGEVVRNRRAYLEEVERRLCQAERTKEEAALRRAGEERLWIAQELHDSLTHSISVINVQAGVAMHLIDRDPAQTREALAAIKESGQEAMRELRATLGVLRQADGDGPPAGLARLPRLVARAEAVGLPVSVVATGERRTLPGDVDRAAYRILQEAFTNVLRHAGPASVTVTTAYHPDKIILTVDDDGRSVAGAGADGMGIIGMRERAVAVGGTLTAGPRPQGGFGVHAELPLPETP
ncbi:two-component sensor histidine kinase [Microtetraspora sp. NBRC 13810]|nr:two-component sensor histidine kinase [Microtetraspora sp. NBRC 13810]